MKTYCVPGALPAAWPSQGASTSYAASVSDLTAVSSPHPSSPGRATGAPVSQWWGWGGDRETGPLSVRGQTSYPEPLLADPTLETAAGNVGRDAGQVWLAMSPQLRTEEWVQNWALRLGFRGQLLAWDIPEPLALLPESQAVLFLVLWASYNSLQSKFVP